MPTANWQYQVNGKYYIGVRRYAEIMDLCDETVRRHLRARKIPGAIVRSGMWMIPAEQIAPRKAAKP